MNIPLEEPYIELNNVSFSYDHTPVIENLTFTVRKGEYLGIIGPNGGGKTTLIKVILGLLHPTEGAVMLFGKDRHDFKEKYRIGYVPQRITQTDKNFPATVFEVVRTGRIARLGFFERFKKEFSQTASSVEGSGWAALAFCDQTRRLIPMQIEKHNVNLYPDCKILMVLDVFEHAYYLDYKNERAKFIEAFWNIVNWDAVAKKSEIQ